MGVATTSRLLSMIGIFCRISSLYLGSFAKETYNFKEPTNHSHPTPSYMHCTLISEKYDVNVADSYHVNVLYTYFPEIYSFLRNELPCRGTPYSFMRNVM